MICWYVDQNQKNRDEHLPLLTAAYNSVQNSRTGFSSNMLMLGRHIHQPQNIWLGLAVDNYYPSMLTIPLNNSFDFVFLSKRGLQRLFSSYVSGVLNIHQQIRVLFLRHGCSGEQLQGGEGPSVSVSAALQFEFVHQLEEMKNL
ncbi:hypothetical protein AMECASPLE_038043 [Ameca splendens]|uniref:Uncharacterized protein n=1 Tax=Ameca splendens TaxID=208324 RepID=A0ABV0ZSU9_9TELE